MDDGFLSLKWNNHGSTFFDVLSSLRQKGKFTDATLVTEGKFFPVHKLVMSTCSEYFEEIFEHISCKCPVIVLKDIKKKSLEDLLNYMYLGEVDVRQTELAELIKAAECLRIKGLAVPDEDPSTASRKRETSSPTPRSSPKRLKKDSTKTSRHSHATNSANNDHSNVTDNASQKGLLIPVETIKLEDPVEDINSVDKQEASEYFDSTENLAADSVNESFSKLHENAEEISKEEHNDSIPGPSGIQNDNSWANGEDSFPMYNDDASQHQACMSTMDPEMVASKMCGGSITVSVKPKSELKKRVPKENRGTSVSLSTVQHQSPLQSTASGLETDGIHVVSENKWQQSCTVIDVSSSPEVPMVNISRRDDKYPKSCVPSKSQLLQGSDAPKSISNPSAGPVNPPAQSSSSGISSLVKSPCLQDFQYSGIQVSNVHSVPSIQTPSGNSFLEQSSDSANSLTCVAKSTEAQPVIIKVATRDPSVVVPKVFHPMDTYKSLESPSAIGRRLSNHTCPICPYQTHSRVDMKKHLCTHSSEKPFNCPMCSYKTGDKSNFKRHMMGIHKSIVLPNFFTKQ